MQKTVKYRVENPIELELYHEDGDWSEVIPPHELPDCLDEMRQLIADYDQGNLAEWIDDTKEVSKKVSSIKIDLEKVGNTVKAITEIIATEPLTAEDRAELCMYLEGQMADGYGEGLEQQEFMVGYEDVECEEWDEDEQETMVWTEQRKYMFNLHLWFMNGKPNYGFPETPWYIRFLPENTETEKTDTEEMQTPNMPVAKLSGQDGNVFNLIGIAQSALKKAGMREQAHTMVDRCFKSGSYSEALGIIAEYCTVQ